jgi:hypothetical protein
LRDKYIFIYSIIISRGELYEEKVKQELRNSKKASSVINRIKRMAKARKGEKRRIGRLNTRHNDKKGDG